MNPWSSLFSSNDSASLSDTSPDEGTDATESPRTPEDVFVETGLTPEEFILQEVRSRDTPITQQEICCYTGWSDSRISCLLSEMEDAGTIGRVRIGRENIVFLPDAKWESITPSLTDEA